MGLYPLEFDVLITGKLIAPAELPDNASVFNKIVPISGKNKPYEPEFVVYPVPEYAEPFDPDTTW